MKREFYKENESCCFFGGPVEIPENALWCDFLEFIQRKQCDKCIVKLQ